VLPPAPVSDTPHFGKPSSVSAAGPPAELASRTLATPDLQASLALLDSATSSAPEELAAANFLQAADFAELTEELSRRVEYLQLLAAAAVDRTRTEAINAAGKASRAGGWTTGWGNEPEPATAPDAQPTAAAAATARSTTAATSNSTTTAAIDAPRRNHGFGFYYGCSRFRSHAASGDLVPGR
jgi:hypothetical protein